jgi:hypothetical protein
MYISERPPVPIRAMRVRWRAVLPAENPEVPGAGDWVSAVSTLTMGRPLSKGRSEPLDGPA